MKCKLSFIIPCYRSEHTISSVIAEIVGVMREQAEYDYEIITINDDSPDNVLSVLRDIVKQFPVVKVIDLAKNVGKHSALMAGYSLASGDVIVSLDDDGQCPVNELWNLLEPLNQGFDNAIARYPKKKQSALKNFGSKVNDWMACFLIEKPKDLKFSNFSAIKRFVRNELLHYQNPYPYTGGFFLKTTSKIKNVEMEERERLSGTSGYTFRKSFSLWMNGFTAFSVRPLRLATIFGIFTAMIGFCLAVLIIVKKILNPTVLAGYSSIMAALLFIGGMIMMLLGLVGEYVGRIYISLNNSPQYVIREIVRLKNGIGEQTEYEKSNDNWGRGFPVPVGTRSSKDL